MRNQKGIPVHNMQYMQLTSRYAPAWGFGGPTRLLYDYARWIAGTGIATTVITGDIHHDYSRVGPKKEIMHDINVTRVRFCWRTLAKKRFNIISPAMLFVAAWKVFRSPEPVIMHVGELRGTVPLYATIIKRMFSRKVRFFHSAFGLLHYKKSTRRRIYDWLFMKALLRCVDSALVQNDHEMLCYKEYCTKYGVNIADRHITLFPLHVDRTPKATARARDASLERLMLRKRYAIPETAFVLIFLGRLHPAKGILRAIDTFLRFKSGYSGDTLFLIVGRDDGMQQQLFDYIKERRAPSSIRIVNDVYADRFDYYTLADIFIGFPTIYEETMLASVEALSCGTPVLVSREADIPFVESAQAGFVINFSVDAAVERIHRVAAQADIYRECALRVAESHFSHKVAASRFISLLNTA